MSVPSRDDSSRPPLPSDEEWEAFTNEINSDDSIRPLGPRDWIEVEDDEDGFSPPDAPPIFGGEPLLTLAWLLAVVPPLAMFVLLIAWRSAPLLLWQGLGSSFIAGLGLLLWRMPDRRQSDEDDT